MTFVWVNRQQYPYRVDQVKITSTQLQAIAQILNIPPPGRGGGFITGTIYVGAPSSPSPPSGDAPPSPQSSPLSAASERGRQDR
jgi:hypothetical protein